MYAHGVFKDSRKWALNTTPTTTFILRKTLKKEVTTLWKRNKFFCEGFQGNTLFWKHAFERNTFFFMYVKKNLFENIIWKKKRKKKEKGFLKTHFIYSFLKFRVPLKEKGKRNYFLRIKFRTPPYFLENNFFFFVWKRFENNFLMIFESRF